MNRFALDTSLVMAAVLFLTLVLTNLSYPLIWEDESDSVMFGQRVLRYGFPKVHDERNTLYGLKEKLEIGVDPDTDAYTGAPWVNYYVAAIGVGLAERVDDIYEKTLRLRLPYSLIGITGLALFFFSVAPAFKNQTGSRRRAGVVFLLMLSISTSLILHLREARYYPIVILFYGVLLYHFIGHHFFARISYARYNAASFVTLFLLFNTFYPSFGVWCAGTSVYLGLRALRSEGRIQDRALRLAKENAPVFLATAAVLPLLFYFDFALQAGRWFDQHDSTLGAYGMNLWVVFYNMMRFEFLAPALLLKILIVAMRPGQLPAEQHKAVQPLMRVSNFLAILLLCYWVVVTRSPFIFERYFLTMGPLISIMILIDGNLLVRLMRARPTGSATSLPAAAKFVNPRNMLALTGLTAAALFFVRLPEIEGRLYEMRHQYKGPADYYIPYILEKYEHPEELVVATNYAEPVLMYYLGSHVTIGYYATNLESDLEIQPDIIVPRPWKQQINALEILVARVPYTVKSFEVKNQMTNNIPALSPYAPGGLRHRYKTVLAATPREQTKIFERVVEEPRSRDN